MQNSPIIRSRFSTRQLVEALQSIDEDILLARTDALVAELEDTRQALIALHLPTRVRHRERSYRLKRQRNGVSF